MSDLPLLRAEIERLKHCLDILETICAEVMDQNEKLRALLNDEVYIRCKADYNRGRLSHANYLDSKEYGLALVTHEVQSDG